MSFNQFMHPRNIYRIRPNYNELSKQYPEFGENVLYDDAGNVHVDYSNMKALRSLTRTLLKHDFNLDVHIPEGRLVPTLPMRLNYLLWIEDLLQVLKKNDSEQNTEENVVGFDIGTGCCAIFPLLGVRMNSDWNFLASDIDPISISVANKNIETNDLQERIKVFENKSEKMFFDEIVELITKGEKITFTMTNPPFFEDAFDGHAFSGPLSKTTLHTQKIQETDNNESITSGGEVAFVKKIITESLSIRDKIKLYTVLLGRKKSFNELKQYLEMFKQEGTLSSFTFTELYQGNTKRWALAWSFSPTTSLISPSPKKCKPAKPLRWVIPRTQRLKPYNMEHIVETIKDILQDLQLEFEVTPLKRWFDFEIKSNVNTWSNQRRKRRQQALQGATKQEEEEDNVPVTPKRQHDSDDEEDNLMEIDHPRDDKTNNITGDKKKNKEISGLCKTDLTLLLHCVLTVKRYQSEVEIKIAQKEMCRDNESIHELFQCLKNRLSR